MNVEAVWNGAVGEIQEPPELIGPVAFGEVCDHLARRDIERCVEVCRAVAHVVVALAFKNARSHREDRLGPVERLDPGLLVDAEHHGTLVGSGQGAVPVSQPARLPGPPSEPDMRVSTHPALRMAMPSN